MFICGIDPGSTGAISIFRCDNNYNVEDVIIEDMGVRNEKDENRYNRIKEIAAFIIKNTFGSMEESTYIMKEKTNAMPREGVSSARTFGWQSGIIDGVIATVSLISSSAYGCDVDIKEIRPQEWRKEIVNIEEEKGLGRKQRKENNFIKAVMLFPNLEHLLTGSRGGAKDGRVDALLITEFNRRVLKGLVTLNETKKEEITEKKLTKLKKRVSNAQAKLESKSYTRKYYSNELSRAKRKLANMEKSLKTIEKMYRIMNN